MKPEQILEINAVMLDEIFGPIMPILTYNCKVMHDGGYFRNLQPYYNTHRTRRHKKTPLLERQ